MPLVECPECGQQVWTQAAACRSCGYAVAKSLAEDSPPPAKEKRLPRGGCLVPMVLAVLLYPVISAVVPDAPCSGFHSTDRQRLESAEIEQSLGINAASDYLERQSELEALGCTVEGAESDGSRNGWYLALWSVGAVLVWPVYNVTGRLIGAARQVPDPAD